MKKSTRVLLVLAFVFTIFGAAFGIVSVCIGFEMSDFQEVYKSGRIRLVAPGHWKAEIEEIANVTGSEGKDFDSSYTQIESLKLDMGKADCVILPSESDEWRVTGYDLLPYFSCQQRGDTLKIGFRQGFWSFLQMIVPHTRTARLEIRIPRDQLTERIQLDLGTGDLTMREGMIRCERMEIDCGVGDIQLRADITERLEIDGGVGSAQVMLYGEESDFDYDIDNGVGTVCIGTQEYYELGSDARVDNNAGKEVRIDSGVGDVTLQFTEEEQEEEKTG